MKYISIDRKREEKNNRIKMVFDTNVIVSALLWTGIPHELLVMAKKGEISLAMSFDMLVELEEVLGREKFQHRIKAINTTIEELISSIKLIVKFYTVLEKIEGICLDIDDDMFLECAIASNSKYILSGDMHLLSLGSFRDIQILRPRDFYDNILK
ncbi:putative toxin-antitoxin system toxin component, PIN family [Candidatus Desantisbacteria bacterium CG_4_9_14_3_um_filter_40_11]|uniref:Putative toxin-antitoxin system toxin component, PIN family n=4 Tax=unclassified Candidatus Desantisiibacteriota TaxID=3106372 RepID=A0A2M7JD08_9BACT|nr:MAG: putative toxin-antitoxin system toxin component, PIN family [Candidatus Desantisbacteria bacterium CG23_combo_of_CG06-09_8_20_14_all_40_23]PIX17271.1 MAG: putative toxin-antitoxin system toxin component, PIN family [Candidatus Desantisbacteria bacterium CG_4_8_14_3_um_filter_40_12]PIY18828.1 MAG: putative toxin-antitoxin system toxin component, PIN family [Candidatus Desantisbacteria bacterium CG_4_10_14_3_um_filter_40_18]PJB30413.1 MAG: putative toxin-antitoxin system toxin component, P